MNEVLQHWDGYVTRIGARVVEVVLLDVTAGDQVANEVALILRHHINPETLAALRPGTFVTWKIEKTPTSVVSRFGLTPAPVVTQEDIDAAAAEAKELAANLRFK